MSWAIASTAMGRGFKAQTERCAKVWANWWRDRYIYRSCMTKDPGNVTRWKHKFGFARQRSAIGHSDVEMGGRRGRLDTARGTRTTLRGRCDDQSPEDDETADRAK